MAIQKKHLYLIGILIEVACSLSGSARIRYIRNFDYSKPTAEPCVNLALPSKIQRVSSLKGEINLIFYTDMPDSIKTAILVAKDLWEMKLHNKKPVYIEIGFEPLENGTVMATETGIYEDDNNHCPAALASQWREQRDDYNEQPDGCITLNSDLDWNCSFLNENQASYNVTTMTLRGICRCLGFVSSITETGNSSFYFSDFSPTIFDRHLYNDNVCLSEIEPYSERLTKFVTSDNVFISTESTKYQMYAPKEYKQGESICYLKKDKSLMSYSLGKGNQYLNIDNITIDILNALGWGLPSESLKIECKDIDESGIGSCYKDHIFKLADNGPNISNYLWTFSLKNKNENYEVICKDNTKEFKIGKIDNPKDYYFNSNGDLQGKIECAYRTDGQDYFAEPFYISLEQKPLIVSYSNFTRTWDKYNFSLNFNVNYTGAEKLLIIIEEEFDPYINTYKIEEPFIAHVHTDLISGLYYSWITIEASNKYGSTKETLEIPPYFQDNDLLKIASSNHRLYSTEENAKIQIFNFEGSCIFEGFDKDFSNNITPSGIYIKRVIYPSGESTTHKIIIK